MFNSLCNICPSHLLMRLSLKVNEASDIHVYLDAQVPVVVEIKDFKKRYLTHA